MKSQIMFWGAASCLIFSGLGFAAGLHVRQNYAVQVVDYGCIGTKSSWIEPLNKERATRE